LGDYGKAKAVLDNEIAKLRKIERRDPIPPWQLAAITGIAA